MTPEWVPCTRVNNGARLKCPVPGGATVVVAPVASPRDVRIRAVPPGGSAQGSEHAPGVVLVAGLQGIEEFAIPGAALPDMGILLDPHRDRVLLGSPSLLRSVFTQLMLLDGRYLRHFEKVGEQTSARGERVVAWKIRGPRPSE